MNRLCAPGAVVSLCLVGWLALPAGARAADPTSAEFFERQIRPLLAQKCYRCHDRGAESKGELQVSSREGLLEGGTRGPAIVPGDADSSLLMAAVRHASDDGLKMPPGAKLSDEQIVALEQWVGAGAPWPEAAPAAPADGRHWSFKPVADVTAPEVADDGWGTNELDRFIWQQLAAHDLRPAPPADWGALLRRVTYDLTGLPPTADELAAFLAAPSPAAYELAVERLLASPRYGERWGRHWLDLVRYSDTNGMDNDFNKPNAYQYRDYVIEALNDDLPYDQFVREHVAGDLLPEPRRSADGGHWASPAATAAWWLGEMLNAPADKEVALANELENRMDVLGKAFMGLTLACARCHDHKFDDITADDYYALAGIFESSTNEQRCLDTPERAAAIEAQLAALDENAQAIAQLVDAPDARLAWLDAQIAVAGRSAAHLLAARERAGHGGSSPGDPLDAVEIELWNAALEDKAALENPLLLPWNNLLDVPDDRFARRMRNLVGRLRDYEDRREANRRNWVLIDDFNEPADLDQWARQGPAFAGASEHPLPRDLVGHDGSGVCSSFGGSDVLTGCLTRKVKIEHRYLTVLAAGDMALRAIGINVNSNSQVLPEPDDVSATGAGDHRMRRIWLNVQPYLGQEVMLEITDNRTQPGGHVLLDDLCFTDESPFPSQWPEANRRVLEALDDSSIETPADAAERIEGLIVAALTAVRERVAQAPDAAAVAEAMRLPDPAMHEIFVWATGPQSPWTGPTIDDVLTDEARARLAELRGVRDRLEAEFPRSTMAIVTVDRAPADMPRHESGDPHQPGDLVSRGFVTALCEADARPELTGSGRLELANWIASHEHPLTARVVVNRLWQHHFGRGLVMTPDNFGALGEVPSHAELLDWLAARLVDEGWSLKAMHRLMVTSSTYRQASLGRPEDETVDPDNVWLHRMVVGRLEAEAVRDAMLAVSGQLDDTMYGPGVPIYRDRFTEGEDLPYEFGPLDGQGRRSIYLEVRTNHLMGLLTAFDLPKPTETVGRRNRSVVAHQGLALLNDPFVRQQAEAWAARVLAAPQQSPETRLERMYLDALSRAPTAEELAAAFDFLAAQTARYTALGESAAEAQRQAWADWCQVMFNLSEFIFIP